MLFGDGFGHELEKTVLIRDGQRIVKIPVHFPLAVGIFVVALVGPPAHFEHIIANFADHFVAAHHSLLIVTGLGCSIQCV